MKKLALCFLLLVPLVARAGDLINYAPAPSISAAEEQRRALYEAVRNHHVVIGMSAAQCREAWGEPNSINRSTYSDGGHEQWVYAGGRAFHDGSGNYVVTHASGGYLYLDNGILTSIQETAR